MRLHRAQEPSGDVWMEGLCTPLHPDVVRSRPSQSPPGEPLSTALFNLTATLSDSIDLNVRTYRATMRVTGGQDPSDDVWMQRRGTPLLPDVVRRLLPAVQTHGVAVGAED